MKYLKLFENNNNKWDKYVLELYNNYMKLEDDDDVYEKSKIDEFFDSVQDEIDDSEDIDIWLVKEYNGNICNVVKAYGNLHAVLKSSIELQDSYLIFDNSIEVYLAEDGEIERNIKYLESNIEHLKVLMERYKNII